jgi:hypothetical protein
MRFPKDAIIEDKIRDAHVDNMVITMLSTTGTYEGRRHLAEFIMVLRQHLMTRDNVQVLPGGTEGRCDRCGMKILVPSKPKPGESPIHGRAAELNCPEARRGRKADGYADMPVHMYEKFLIDKNIEKPWEVPTSFDPYPDISERLAKIKADEDLARNRFFGKSENQARLRDRNRK